MGQFRLLLLWEISKSQIKGRKRVIGNWTMTSLTGIEHEVIEETKRYCLGVAAIFLTEGSSITVDLRDVWKLLESDFELAKFSKA